MSPERPSHPKLPKELTQLADGSDTIHPEAKDPLKPFMVWIDSERRHPSFTALSEMYHLPDAGGFSLPLVPTISQNLFLEDPSVIPQLSGLSASVGNWRESSLDRTATCWIINDARTPIVESSFVPVWVQIHKKHHLSHYEMLQQHHNNHQFTAYTNEDDPSHVYVSTVSPIGFPVLLPTQSIPNGSHIIMEPNIHDLLARSILPAAETLTPDVYLEQLSIAKRHVQTGNRVSKQEAKSLITLLEEKRNRCMQAISKAQRMVTNMHNQGATLIQDWREQEKLDIQTISHLTMIMGIIGLYRKVYAEPLFPMLR